MNLLNFIEQFTDEESCKLMYKKVRDKVGVTCSVFDCKMQYWKKISVNTSVQVMENGLHYEVEQ